MGNLRKGLSVILILLFIMNMLVSAFAIEGLTSHPVYEGISNGSDQLKNLQYTDIANHWGREAIQEASALSLMRGLNNNRFMPDSSLTYIEALTALVRGLGLETEAQKFGENQAPANVRNIIILSAVDNWAKGYVQVAVQNGIVTNQEVNEILNLTQQQMTSLETQLQTQLEGYRGGTLTQQELNTLEGQIRDKLNNNTAWNRPVSRQQVALWVARTIKLEPLYGANIVKLYSFVDWQQVDTDKLPLVEAILQKGVMKGTSDTSFSPRGNFTRAQMAQLLVNINDDLLAARGLTKKTGYVVDIETIQQQQAPRQLFSMSNNDGTRNFIAAEPAKGIDFPVQRGTQLSLSASIKKGESLIYYIDSSSRVVFAKLVDSELSLIEGFIDFIDYNNNRLLVVDFDNQKHMLQIETITQIQINGKLVDFKDLFYGQEVLVTLQQGKVTSIEGLLEEDPNLHGYIPPGSRVKVGDILQITKLSVELRTEAGREIYRITPETQAVRNGKAANLFEVKNGDRVMLTFNDIYSADISEIKVEDSERHITGIYRGTIESVSERNKELTLNTVTMYDNGAWTKHADQKVKLKVEDNIYQGANKITLAELAAAKGQEVYAAVEASFGVERVAKLQLKEGSAQLFESKITGLEFGRSQLIVNNNIVGFHPGTIVVKNNRLVDILNLQNQRTVYIATDLNKGVRRASLITMEYDGMLEDRIDGTRLVVYRGRIEGLGDYSITIARLAYQLDYLKFQDNQWVEMERPKKFTMSEDTYVYESGLKKEIEAGYLLNSRFVNPDNIVDPILRSRVKNNYYLNKTAYVVVKEARVSDYQTTEEVISINLTPDLMYYGSFVNTDHGAMAEVEKVDIDAEELALNSIRHWNALNKRWETTKTKEAIDIKKAVILINDRPVKRDELYLIKAKAQAYIIKNKNVSTGDDAYVIIIEQ